MFPFVVLLFVSSLCSFLFIFLGGRGGSPAFVVISSSFCGGRVPENVIIHIFLCFLPHVSVLLCLVFLFFFFCFFFFLGGGGGGVPRNVHLLLFLMFVFLRGPEKRRTHMGGL